MKKSVSLGAQLLLRPRRAVAIAAGPGFSAIEIAAVAPIQSTLRAITVFVSGSLRVAWKR